MNINSQNLDSPFLSIYNAINCKISLKKNVRLKIIKDYEYN